MTDDEARAALSDFESLVRGRPDQKIDPLEAALFLEDALGIKLSDSEISGPSLGDPDSIRGFALSKLRP
jgi:hypothetical protein